MKSDWSAQLGVKLLVTVSTLFSGVVQAEMPVIKGAGSTAAAMIYQSWGKEFQSQEGVALTYEAIGSGAGIKKIKAREVDFGATDVAPGESDLVADGLLLIPVAITGIAPVFNLPQIKDQTLRLTGDVLAQIYLGQITRWNSVEIAVLNPGVKLPDAEIKVVVRSDGSGTSYNLGDYLSKVNASWKSSMGAKTTYPWPQGFIGVKGSDAVVKAVRDTVGSIGYVDYGYVKDNKLSVAWMRNQEGEFVKASAAAFRAALMRSDWAQKGVFTGTLTDSHGKESWPLTMGTYALIPRVVESAAQGARTLNYFVWALLKGDAAVEENAFVRLPNNVQASAFKQLITMRDKSGAHIPFSMKLQ